MPRGFWRRHALLPGVLFLAVAWAGAFTPLDAELARSWALAPGSNHFIGQGSGEWWAKQMIHSGGGALIRLAGLLLVLSWLATHRVPSLGDWRRPLAYSITAVLIGIALVSVLKAVTNVDCPSNLDLFGGKRPYIHLFADRPDTLPRARCFPGGHSSSGFAFFVLYFALRDRYRAAAIAGLWLALVVGVLFAFGQEARGAHFLSHDAWSAAIMWFTALGLYAWGYRARLWPVSG